MITHEDVPSRCPRPDPELPPNLDARAQHRRRVVRFGEQWVRFAEAVVDATAENVPGGLCRENVLSLMEGAYSRGLADHGRGDI
jgi:hypothetical protein